MNEYKYVFARIVILHNVYVDVYIDVYIDVYDCYYNRDYTCTRIYNFSLYQYTRFIVFILYTQLVVSVILYLYRLLYINECIITYTTNIILVVTS